MIQPKRSDAQVERNLNRTIKKKKKIEDRLEKRRHRVMGLQPKAPPIVGAHDEHLDEGERAIMRASDAAGQ